MRAYLQNGLEGLPEKHSSTHSILPGRSESPSDNRKREIINFRRPNAGGPQRTALFYIHCEYPEAGLLDRPCNNGFAWGRYSNCQP